MTRTIHTFSVPSPGGPLRGAATDAGLALLTFDGRDFETQLVQRFGPACPRVGAPDHPAARELAEYVRGDRRAFAIAVDLGDQAVFRRRVLTALRTVPYGETVTYGELAERAGSPRAARAAGGAVGNNPVPIVVP